MGIENFKKIKTSLAYAAKWSIKNENGSVLKKLRNSIFKNKQTQAFFARKVGDKYEIFKGKRAFSILTEKETPEILIYDFGEISELESKLIYFENSINHSDNYIEVGEIIKELNLSLKAHEFERFINFSLSEIEDLINLSDFDWNKYLKKQPKEVQTSFFD